MVTVFCLFGFGVWLTGWKLFGGRGESLQGAFRD